MDYDIAVIGNDEAALEILRLAAGSGKRTVAVLPETRHSAWLAGQALRRLVSDLIVDQTAQRRQLFSRTATPRLLHALLSRAIVSEVTEQMHVLESLGIDVLMGETRFVSDNSLTVCSGATGIRQTLGVRHIVIGTGVRRTAMHRRPGLMPFHRPEALFAGRLLPRSICVLGGGHFGIGLAALMSIFGVDTRLVAREDNTSVMLELATAAGVQIGHHPADVGLPPVGGTVSELQADVVDCRRVVGFTDHLNLSVVDVEPDENGQLWCADNFETWCSGIFGIGEVVGFSPDTALHPAVQAERIMNRITHSVSRPHLVDAFTGRSVSGYAGKRAGQASAWLADERNAVVGQVK